MFLQPLEGQQLSYATQLSVNSECDSDMEFDELTEVEALNAHVDM